MAVWPGYEGIILTCYRRDCYGSARVLEWIRRARAGEPVADSWSGNEVFVDFYPDRAVISHQWIYDARGEAEVAISLDDAEALLQAEEAELATVLDRVIFLPPGLEPAGPGDAPGPRE
jgi:hypothetical protein